MRNAAIIGISNYARHHLLMALEQALHGRLKLVAATIVNEAEEGFFCDRLRSLGCEIFASTDAMWQKFSGRIDLCFIPTGIHLHASQTLQALYAGAHVFVEKPLAATVEQVQLIRAAERKTGLTVSVGFQDLYPQSTWDIKQLILEGRLGTIETFSLVGLWPRPVSYYNRNNWAGRLDQEGQPVMDSPVNNAFAHFINLALFWAGDRIDQSGNVTELACELYRTHKIESFDTVCARARLSNQARLCFFLTHSCIEDRTPRLVVKGTEATLTWTQESDYELQMRGQPTQRYAIPQKFETKLQMADAAVARINGEPARVCTTEIALEHARLVEALHTIAPIHTLSSPWLEHYQSQQQDWLQIKNIEEACDRGASEQLLWSEQKLPWSQPASIWKKNSNLDTEPKAMSLDNISEFSRKKA